MPRTRGLTDRQKEEFRQKLEEERMKKWQGRCSRIIKRMMGYYGTTQGEIAKVIDRSRAAVCERITGKTAWTAQELVLVADFFEADDDTRAALLNGRSRCRWEDER